MGQDLICKDDEMYCLSCQGVIVNPVCNNCIMRELESWILNKKPSLIPIFRARIKNTDIGIKNDIKCIICNRNVNSCVHCLIEDIFYLLEDEYPKLAEEFNVLFNYR